MARMISARVSFCIVVSALVVMVPSGDAAFAKGPNGLAQRVEKLEKVVKKQKAKVKLLTATVSSLQAALAALQQTVANLQATVAGLQADQGGLVDQVANLELVVLSQADQIAALVDADQLQAAQIAALEADGSAQDAQIAALGADNAALNGALAALVARVGALEAAQGGDAGCAAGEAPVCCPQGETFCPTLGCVDLASNDEACGGCGTACGPELTCLDGACGLACVDDADCGVAGDACVAGQCTCGGGAPCLGQQLCGASGCTLCGNGVVDSGEECDDGNDDDTDLCTNACTAGVCAPEVIFAVGVFGTTTCDSRCASQGEECIGIGTDDEALNGQFMDCGSATSGVATSASPGTCATVLGGQGCSEYTSCRCAPTSEEQVVFAVGVFGTTTCDSRCSSEGGVCAGIGTDSGATDGMFMDCGSATSGVAISASPGTCATVLGGQGCSEYTSCRCKTPSPTCSETAFAVGVFGTTTCESRCLAEGGTCVGLGTDDDGLNGLYNACAPGATSGVATTTAPGSCSTVLGGNGCSEFATCRCYIF
ncbi:MAG: hypothetical protein H6744_13120 [Deltaproteobacteria bacterium]|nr:hypothetical protein [Deltaproteobacteria bacterium]